MKYPLYGLLIFVLMFSACPDKHQYLLIRGGTLIDAGKLGTGINDMDSSYILISGDTILDVGSLSSDPEFPRNTRVIDASGKFIIPGLIDGFAVLNNQTYANAFLYMGITSIIEVDGGRRGPFYTGANPSPACYRLESVGDDKKSTGEHISDLEQLHEKAYSVALLKYALLPEQVAAVMKKAKELGMGCIGELGNTSYKKGIEAGVKAFVHTTRYSLDIAPEEMAAAVADEPFSDDMSSPKWTYYKYLSSLQPDDPALLEHARTLGSSDVFLMPTMSLLYLDMPEHKNPWDYKVADILNPEDINNPADRVTGNHNYPEEVQKNYTAMALQEYMIERTYLRNGAKYLAGSATDVWGTMPGISLHTELELLQSIGLTNRETLAAATSNFHQAFGWNIGLIKKGFQANLLILNNNPVDSLLYLQDFEQLILKGALLDRNSLLK